MDQSLSLWTLLGSSFLAATLLPGGSEAVLFGVLKLDAHLYWPALAEAFRYDQDAPPPVTM